jgi:hypothetical protein
MQGLDPATDILDYSARCRQVHELGCDCYDFVPLADRRLALTIGDASGKGLAAALMMEQRARCSMLMRATTPRYSFDETARSFGLEPVAHRSEYSRNPTMRKALFSSIRETWSWLTLTG